jgi:ABC-type multidrug transport system ATPase subunit/ABC-type uncharacterized transport system permease subunit
MIDISQILVVGFKEGLIWFPIVVGIGIIYSHLKVLDISVDGIVIACGIACGFAWNYSHSYLISIMVSVITGILLAAIVCFFIFKLKIHPIMSGIIFSLAIHTLSVVLVGESILFSETKLISGILTIPLWLIFLTLITSVMVETFFMQGLGVEIRAFGDNNQINTRRNPFFLALITYAVVGGLYGLGAAIYSHSEGLARSGGSFEFLIIALSSFLSIDRLIWYLKCIGNKRKSDPNSSEIMIGKIRQTFFKFWNMVSVKALLGVVFFQTVVFYVIFKTSNPIYWKIVLSFILLISLINYEAFATQRKKIGERKKHKYHPAHSPSMVNQLTLEGISMTYLIGIEKRKVFENMNVGFSKGINIVRGPNGSGKSTLLKIIKGIIYPQKGKLIYRNAYLTGIPFFQRPAFYISQNPFDVCAPDLTIIENLSTSIPGYSKIGINCSKSRILKLLFDSLQEIGVEPIRMYESHFWQKEARSLSGGEAQIICLYMSLLSRRPVVLLDEPTTGLDNQNFGRLVVLLEALSETKIIVLTSHDKRLEEFNFKSFYITNFILECNQMVNRTIKTN